MTRSVDKPPTNAPRSEMSAKQGNSVPLSPYSLPSDIISFEGIGLPGKDVISLEGHARSAKQHMRDRRRPAHSAHSDADAGGTDQECCRCRLLHVAVHQTYWRTATLAAESPATMHENASRIHSENVVALFEPEPGDGDAQTRSTAKSATLHASPESTSAPFPSQEPPSEHHRRQAVRHPDVVGAGRADRATRPPAIPRPERGAELGRDAPSLRATLMSTRLTEVLV